MKIRIWGCRGSVAAPGPDTVRYGGNTSCVELRTADDAVIVLDAGTGMRPLGALLAAAKVPEVHVLLTHLHLDHLQGLGFFRPLFDPETRVHIWGPPSPVEPLAERIARYMSPPLFPVRLDDIPSMVTFHDAPEEPVRMGSAEVVAAAVTHQGPTVGYRITDAGGSLCYIPDHEPSLGVRLTELEPDWMSGFGLAHRVDLLLHDAQYSDEEYPNHVGWGHSAIEHVVEFARKADVGRLVLFHHDPYHCDEDLEELLALASKMLDRGNGAVQLAYDGMQLSLGS